jgi:hypothetical protein
VLTEQGVGDIQQDASDITLDLRIEAHLGLRLQLLGLLAPLHSNTGNTFSFVFVSQVMCNSQPVTGTLTAGRRRSKCKRHRWRPVQLTVALEHLLTNPRAAW